MDDSYGNEIIFSQEMEKKRHMANRNLESQANSFFANLGYGVLIWIIMYITLFAISNWLGNVLFQQTEPSTPVIVIVFVSSTVIAVLTTPRMVIKWNLRPLKLFTAFLLSAFLVAAYDIIARLLGLSVFDTHGQTSLATDIVSVVALIVAILVTPSLSRRYKR